MALVEGRVGPRAAQGLGDNSPAEERFSRTGAQVVTDGHARFYEAVARGNVYGGGVPPGTGVAGGTAIGTTAALALGNPAGSGVLLVVMSISTGYISGTLGAGSVYLLLHNASPPIAAPSSGTAIVAQNLRTDATNQSKANFRFNCTVPGSGLAIRSLLINYQAIASSAIPASQLIDNTDGLVIVGPGTAISIQPVIGAAQSSPLWNFSMTWEEVPL